MLTYKMYQTCDKKAIHTTRLEMVRSCAAYRNKSYCKSIRCSTEYRTTMASEVPGGSAESIAQ